MKHFEVHVTIQNAEGEEQRLVEFCKGRDNIKPVLIDLDGTGHDLMTSSRKTCEDGDYKTFANTITRLLVFNNFKILRLKVESDLEDTPEEAEFYYEAHVRVDGSSYDDPKLVALCKEHKAHKSRNLFKEADTKTQMITIRDGNKTSFNKRVDAIIEALEKSYFRVGEKVEREYCVFDSNVNHDIEWIQKS